MSRHRNVRNRAYSYDEDYDDEYYEEDYYGSPNSQEFMYRRDSPSRQNNIFSFIETDKKDSTKTDSISNTHCDDSELIEPLIKKIQETLNLTLENKDQIADELRSQNYDVDRAMISLLEKKKTVKDAKPVSIPPFHQIKVPSLESVVKSLENTATSSSSLKPAFTKKELPIVDENDLGQQQAVIKNVYQLSKGERATFEKQEQKSQELALKICSTASNSSDGSSLAKERISMVILGHVDAGKSTLTGHLLYKLGYVNQKTIHKYEKESKERGKSSFSFAWVMDADEDERERGVTMDVGMGFFESKSKHVTLLDAPGHVDFIPKMIAGASQADVGILVVPACTGEFEAAFENSGQTKEHTILARSLGVNQLIVAVNKMDSIDWSEDRFHYIKESMKKFLLSSGFRQKNIWFVPVSGLAGENLTTRIESKWYKGVSLIEAIDEFGSPPRPVSRPFRMGVSDVSKSITLGQTVSGRIYTGAIKAGDKVLLMPIGERVTVKAIEQNNVSLEVAKAGDNIDLGITGIDSAALSVGNLLCSIVAPVKLVERFEAQLLILPSVDVPLIKGSVLNFHLHSMDEVCVLSKLKHLLTSTGDVVMNSKLEKKKKPRCLLKGQSAVVELTVLNRRLCLELFQENRMLGRFTLRNKGATVAAGIVTKIHT